MRGVLTALVMLHLGAASCGSQPVGRVYCGDGVAQPNEACDGQDLKGATCASAGFSWGDVSCSASCTLDTSGCVPLGTCGDGVAQLEEDCDGQDLKGATCASFPSLDWGTLICTSDCHLDTQYCCQYNGCGDAVIGCGEQCDWDNMRNQPVLGGATCQSEGYDGGELTCDRCAFGTWGCCYNGVCGNGEVNCGEDCDHVGGDPIFGLTWSCEQLGYSGGTLGCAPDCTLDASACE